MTGDMRAGLHGDEKDRQWRWSSQEDEMLRRYYPDYGACWEGWDELIGRRTRSAIAARAWRIGVSFDGVYGRPAISEERLEEMARAATSALGFSEKLRLMVLLGDGDAIDVLTDAGEHVG